MVSCSTSVLEHGSCSYTSMTVCASVFVSEIVHDHYCAGQCPSVCYMCVRVHVKQYSQMFVTDIVHVRVRVVQCS